MRNKSKLNLNQFRDELQKASHEVDLYILLPRCESKVPENEIERWANERNQDFASCLKKVREHNENLETIEKLEKDSKAIHEARVINAEKVIERKKEDIERERKESEFDLKYDQSQNLMQELDELIMREEQSLNPIPGISPAFDRNLPLIWRTLTLVAATTSSGKTFLICWWVSRLVSKGFKVVIFANETRRIEYYHHIACLILGYGFGKRNGLTDDQKNRIREVVSELEKNKLLVIVDSKTKTGFGEIDTTTVGGIKTLVNQIIKREEDTILFVDYLHKITIGKQGQEEYQRLIEVMNFLDDSKNSLDFSIVVFHQLRKDDGTPFNERTKGCRSLVDKVDVALELIRDHNNQKAEVVVQKARRSDAHPGTRFQLITQKGKFLDPTPENCVKHGYDFSREKKLVKGKREGEPMK